MTRNSLCCAAYLVSVCFGPAIVVADDLVRSGATLQTLATEFRFTEGPAVDRDGNVYFTDQPNDRIMKWSTEGELSTFLQPSGRSNGLYFSRDGRLLACADEHNQLWSIAPDGSHEVLADKYDGKLFNGPNDVWERPDGGIYFTDPFYRRPYWNRDPVEQLGQCVYFLSPDRQQLLQVEAGLQQPNGIVGTANGKTLYVADIRGGRTYAYDIQPSGELSNRRLFCEMGSDGMTLDDQGNVYLTGNGVIIFSPTGEKLRTIEIPERWTANVCFGGKERRTLFITASQGLYALEMNVAGVR